MSLASLPSGLTVRAHFDLPFGEPAGGAALDPQARNVHQNMITGHG
jgi:hypothetical protein